jgi:hypothetical protein
MRRSQRDAWLHATTTLRKVGQQLRRKVEAVSLAIASDPGFRTMLGLAEGLTPTQQQVWIADTCIECDHQRFGGFLKVSVEELIIALRDDRHLLNDPAGLLAGSYGVEEACEPDASESSWSLYPDGFSAERFAEVIETGLCGTGLPHSVVIVFGRGRSPGTLRVASSVLRTAKRATPAARAEAASTCRGVRGALQLRCRR